MPEKAYHDEEARIMEEEWVTMYHPDTGGEAFVTKDSFEMVHKDNGWTTTAPKTKASADKESA